MRLADNEISLPLFPLPNVVHFPGTDLKLHVFEPRYRRLVRDLLDRPPEQRFIGMVLIKPGSAGPLPEIFDGGTAGLLIDVDLLPDGRSNILLHGDFRFEVQKELGERPYRKALVRPLPEPAVSEEDAVVLTVRRGLIELVEGLGEEIGSEFPLRAERLPERPDELSFEVFVNRIAAEIDLPALAKVSLLRQALPERAVALLEILRSRKQVLDLLRPFRRLATDSSLN